MFSPSPACLSPSPPLISLISYPLPPPPRRLPHHATGLSLTLPFDLPRRGWAPNRASCGRLTPGMQGRWGEKTSKLGEGRLYRTRMRTRNNGALPMPWGDFPCPPFAYVWRLNARANRRRRGRSDKRGRKTTGARLTYMAIGRRRMASRIVTNGGNYHLLPPPPGRKTGGRCAGRETPPVI